MEQWTVRLQNQFIIIIIYSVADKCELPPEKGPCKEHITRYFKNNETGQCEDFTFGGCDGNANNFETLDECFEECGICPVVACSPDTARFCPFGRKDLGAGCPNGCDCNGKRWLFAHIQYL